MDLGTLGGSLTVASAINDAGQVVGFAETASGDTDAFLYTNGTMNDLGTLGGTIDSYPSSINDAGQVVGQSQTASKTDLAFLYTNGAMTDLNNLLPPDSGWTPTDAAAINDAGQIVGTGVHNGEVHAFLLNPSITLEDTTQPPTSVQVGGKFDVQVAVEDASGNVDTNFTDNISVKLGHDPNGNSTLGGTLTVAAVDGVANFNNLTINEAGKGFTLLATSDGQHSTTTNSFDVSDQLTITHSTADPCTLRCQV